MFKIKKIAIYIFTINKTSRSLKKQPHYNRSLSEQVLAPVWFMRNRRKSNTNSIYSINKKQNYTQ